jgi:calreticulin
MIKLFCVAAFLALATATVYFEEDFTNPNWESRWVVSTHKGAEAGKLGLSSGKFFGDEKADVGLKTLEDARFYQVSAAFPEFSNEGKDLVLQFSVKHEQNIDCGGGYVKILPAGLNQASFNGDSEYNIMFGPDICGGTRRTHAIITYKGKNFLINDNVDVRTDELSHLYTFIISPDQTYKILIDNKPVKEGTFDDWDFLPPKQINDPSVSKPEDWVDEKYIDDPNDVKPEGYDDIPETIADPDAEQPEDWDTELDGEWEAPVIDNPAYKGPWRAKRIENPAYKGEWEHPQIANPEYSPDNNIYKFNSNAFVGIEIWQVKAGTIFDNFLVTDDATLASARAEEALKRFEVEKEKYDEAQEAERKLREAEAEAAAAAAAEEEDEEEEDDGKEEL